jgi:hypothetical protein
LPNNTLRKMMRPRRPLALAPLAAGLLACGGADPSGPTARCSDAPPLLAPASLTGVVVRPGDVGACVRLGGAGARYLVVSQFAGEGSGTARSTFALTASTPASLVTARQPGPEAGLAVNRVQHELDRSLRARERALTPAHPDGRLRLGRAPGAPVGAVTAAAVDSVRTFQVLRTLTGNDFVPVTAALRYTGEHVAIYLDQAAPAFGFSDAALQRFGNLFDRTLYGIDVAAFGAPSDIDQNGRVLVVLTPRVNALTESARCRDDGFVTGYFYGVDLSPGQKGSNRGEVFYALAPDPAGTVSCPHSTSQVEQLTPPTFVHEFQHMISYNEHKLARGGADETTWLNEGLSHVAEELASLHYETRYPAPQQRSAPEQLFPDSAQAFVLPNIVNAHGYLADSRGNSVTSFEDFGTLPERGAAWLFLRWLGDREGPGVYRRLVQTRLTGAENVAAVTGRPFHELFAQFGVAVWADSLPGLRRDAVPLPYRFTSRNLRALFARLAAVGVVRGGFPVRPASLAGGAALSRDMKAGSLDYFELRVPAESASVLVRFAPGAGDQGFPTRLQAQLSVFRLPD